MATAVAAKGLKELLQQIPAFAGSTAMQESLPTAASTFTTSLHTPTLKKPLTSSGTANSHKI